MDYKELFADQSTIKVTVMTIDGKKLTKSLVDQLPTHFPFDKLYNFNGQKIFGFVKLGKASPSNPRAENINFVIFEKGGKIFKFSIDRLFEMTKYRKETSINNFSIRALNDLLGDDSEYYSEGQKEYTKLQRSFGIDHTIEDVLTPVGLEKFSEIINNTKKLYLEIYDHQIFI